MECFFCKACAVMLTRARAYGGVCCQRPRRRDCPLPRPPANEEDYPFGVPPGLVALGTIDDRRQGEIFQWTTGSLTV